MDIFIAALIGLQIGSFLNLLVWRLPRMMERELAQKHAHYSGSPLEEQAAFNLFFPRSHCPSCKATLRVRDLIPVFSYLFLKGKCAHCNTSISFRYPLVEIVVALAWAGCAYKCGLTWQALAWALCVSALIALALIDMDTMYLPDSITLPLMWAGLIASSLGWTLASLVDAMWGAVAGYLSLWLVYQIFLRVTGKEGMGAGDFKLLAVLGAWLGWMALPGIVFFASLAGVLIVIVLRFTQKINAGAPFPFGPSLVLAGLVSLYCGSITDYLGLIF
ncbi:MAG: prepilin peptidase [Limnohabitans sp.]|nr:prepilin peptidase [Limnohabitans sp.]